MQCFNPRTVGFKSDGKTISWSQKEYDKQYATFQLPCGKCLACRLEYARQWAVRCVHEAEMHPQNCFITLTYSDEALKSPKLDYRDFQLFMKKLRKKISEKNLLPEEAQIGFFATGEYGDKTKRPHWHAIIFNWSPPDGIHKYTNERGDQSFTSDLLDSLWSKGFTEYGSVTFESAGYCARYAAKKLSHGRDNEHDFEPISKKSNKHAIGKKYVEKHYESIFNLGFINLPNGSQCSIPRYYEKWLKKNEPGTWVKYVTHKKLQLTNKAKEKNEKTLEEEKRINHQRAARQGLKLKLGTTRRQAKKKILESKFKQLDQHRKL